jgi:FKBP-type peptidyl-prolyl cis-trans isomerase
MAEGTEKAPPAGLPVLETDDEGVPTGFTADNSTDADPKELVVAPVIVGDGPKIEAGQTVTVHYLGQLYPDGEIFDQSWTAGQPFEFQLGTGGVIQGWDQGLEGQTVGSRVILAIPSDLAYGEQGSPPTIPANAPLLFSVDILAAS